MAKSKPSTKASKRSRLRAKDVPAQRAGIVTDPAIDLQEATVLVQGGQPDAALPIANRALQSLVAEHGTVSTLVLPALKLIAEIHIEMGEVSEALGPLAMAVVIDPEGAIPESEGGGAEKFLWLAQLNEEGGHQSIAWFEKGIQALQVESERIFGLMNMSKVLAITDKRQKIIDALCGEIEVWMTDLSYVLKAIGHSVTNATQI